MNQRPFSAAAERNSEPILSILKAWLPETGRVLEIGSGTGQHAERFASAFQRLEWQPSETDEALPTLVAGLSGVELDNLNDPIALDVQGPWPEGPFEAIYSANTVHIMHWPAVQALFTGVGWVLKPGAPFVLYGPFCRNGDFGAESNARFNADLVARDPGMGIRELSDLDELAAQHGLVRSAELQMPANNLMLIFHAEES